MHFRHILTRSIFYVLILFTLNFVCLMDDDLHKVLFLSKFYASSQGIVIGLQ